MKDNVLPKAVINGLTFWPVPAFNDPEVVFGAGREAFFDRCNLPDVPKT